MLGESRIAAPVGKTTEVAADVAGTVADVADRGGRPAIGAPPSMTAGGGTSEEGRGPAAADEKVEELGRGAEDRPLRAAAAAAPEVFSCSLTAVGSATGSAGGCGGRE